MGRLHGALPWVIIATCASVTAAIGVFNSAGVAEALTTGCHYGL